MGTTLDECRRRGHNFLLNRWGDAFACSHGCGEARPRPGAPTCALPPEWTTMPRQAGEEITDD